MTNTHQINIGMCRYKDIMLVLIVMLCSCSGNTNDNQAEIDEVDSLKNLNPQELVEEKPRDAMKMEDKKRLPEDSLVRE